MKKFIDICQFVLVLMGLMICGLFVTSLIGLLPLHGNAMQWGIIAAQNILAFIFPALLTWKMCFKVNPFKAIESDKCPSVKMIGITLLIYFVGMPALNQIVYWNQEMALPEVFSGFEEGCRNMEDQAEALTKDLLGSTNLLPTIINILLIGVLTGIGEEFFFRGAFQRMLIWCRVNHHAAIWIAATVFSALHFQFFGFIPRLLLGAFFGYIYWWSGNIWINAFAHALNNSLVIVSTWCINKGFLSEEFDMMGVSEGGLPVSAIISCVLVA
ncbi:MAG: CPBP family intramembrane metalloprotease, partial [Muribaculaceae bacterium]|nr:CPBP family intramembrane metalloprotease [Muribaculaceae bacterium]